MRTISAANEALFTAVGGRAVFLRVDVDDGAGNFRDLTTWPGENLVLGASWGETVDSPGMSGSVRCKREVELLSLAPLMDSSPLNKAFNPSASPSPLVAHPHELKLYTAVLPDGRLPAGGDWVLQFHGRIDCVKWGGGETVDLQVSDLQGRLRDTFIERERIYAHADPADIDSTKGLFVYEPGRTYAVGDLLVPTEAKRNGNFYAISAITTGIAGAEGTWPTSGGGTATFGGVTVQQKGLTTTTTGTAVETVMQQIVTDNGVSATVTTPSSPGWLIKWYLQQRVLAWDALRQLVDQIGWDLRYRWDSGTSSFKLKFTSIDRAKTTPDRTFSASEKLEVNDLKIDGADIRNVVRVVYSDPADLDSEKNPKRKAVERTNATSITAFGRRFMELAEASSSNIDTQAEAQAMADAALADLASPTAEKSVVFEYFPFCELGDLYRFSGDAVHHSGNLDLAVTGYQHNITENDAVTTFSCRGKPSGGAERWLARAAEVNPDDTHQTVLGNSGGVATISTGKIVGGGKVLATQTFAKRALPAGWSFHISDTPGFTPGAGNFVGAALGNQLPWGEGYGGGTYYGRAIPHGWNAQRKVLGEPSDEFSFTAGFLEPHHLNPEAFRGELPPNGSFEGRFRPSLLPDRWEIAVGTWGTDASCGVAKGIAAADGNRYLLFSTTSVATFVWSDYFPVTREHLYEVLAQVYRVSGDQNFSIAVGWYDSAKGAISSSTLTVSLGALTTSAWNRVRGVFTAPSTAAFARFAISKASAHSSSAYFDACKLNDLGEPWVTIADGSMSNSWVTDTPQTVACRQSRGQVEVRGAVKSGVVGAVFTIPFDPPPQLMRWRTVNGFDGSGELQVTTGGVVTIATLASNSWVSLDCIRYRTF